MAWTITVILLVLWGLGQLAGSTEGAWVHLLFGFALCSLAVAALGRYRAGPHAQPPPPPVCTPPRGRVGARR